MIVVTMKTFALGTIALLRQLINMTGDIPVNRKIRIYQVLQIPSQQRAIKERELAVEAAVLVEMFHQSRKLIGKKIFF